jgi:hypothetical protein
VAEDYMKETEGGRILYSRFTTTHDTFVVFLAQGVPRRRIACGDLGFAYAPALFIRSLTLDELLRFCSFCKDLKNHPQSIHEVVSPGNVQDHVEGYGAEQTLRRTAHL